MSKQDDLKHMKAAIALADRCNPIADRIPKVGAVIAIGSTSIGRGNRGTGSPEDDDHAEKVALGKVDDLTELPRATLYTTLEPCTRDVRSDPLKCCTELISQHEIKRVFIGILDPNQGVRGKGLWELQNRGIDVELFPPELAKRIRTMNHNFIRVQQTLGIRFTDIQAGQQIRTYEKGGAYEFHGTFLNPPGKDVFAFTRIGSKWYPQPHALQVTGENSWTVRVHFGTYGPHTVSIVKASELGATLVSYYRAVAQLNIERETLIGDRLKSDSAAESEIRDMLRFKYVGIDMGALPKGLEVQATVEVDVERPAATGVEIRQIS